MWIVGGVDLTYLVNVRIILGMSRLPFEPRKINSVKPHDEDGDLFGGDAKGAAGGKGDGAVGEALSVSGLAGMIKGVIADNMPRKIKVVGEVSNLSDRTHWFFSLKDEGAAIRAVCFAATAKRVKFKMADGMQVVVTGRVDYYDAQGSIQLYVDDIQAVGQGNLEMEFRALCEELRQLGYFDSTLKRRLPFVPKKVAVITSRKAAALQDVIDTADRRWAGCQLYLCDVRVQGEYAAGEIAKMIDALSEHGTAAGVDVIILTRGGGSIEDLWAFNERVVADAIYRCSIPIVAAIGHETDTTIAELVADARCATPTQAVMRVIPDAEALSEQINSLASRLKLVLNRRLSFEQQRLGAIQRHPIFKRPQTLVEIQKQRVLHLKQRLSAGLPGLARQGRQQLEALVRQLESVNPKNVLKRGYSYTLDAMGKVLTDASQVGAGDKLVTVLDQGQVESVVSGGADHSLGEAVEQKKDEAVMKPSKRGFSFNPAKDIETKKRAAKKDAKPKRIEDDGPGLFG